MLQLDARQALGPLGAVWGLAAILQTSRKAAREGVAGLESSAASGMYLMSDSDDEDLQGMIADDEWWALDLHTSARCLVRRWCM